MSNTNLTPSGSPNDVVETATLINRPSTSTSTRRRTTNVHELNEKHHNVPGVSDDQLGVGTNIWTLRNHERAAKVSRTSTTTVLDDMACWEISESAGPLVQRLDYVRMLNDYLGANPSTADQSQNKQS